MRRGWERGRGGASKSHGCVSASDELVNRLLVFTEKPV